jgi:hypothetical protein
VPHGDEVGVETDGKANAAELVLCRKGYVSEMQRSLGKIEYIPSSRTLWSCSPIARS